MYKQKLLQLVIFTTMLLLKFYSVFLHCLLLPFNFTSDLWPLVLGFCTLICDLSPFTSDFLSLTFDHWVLNSGLSTFISDLLTSTFDSLSLALSPWTSKSQLWSLMLGLWTLIHDLSPFTSDFLSIFWTLIFDVCHLLWNSDLSNFISNLLSSTFDPLCFFENPGTLNSELWLIFDLLASNLDLLSLILESSTLNSDLSVFLSDLWPLNFKHMLNIHSLFCFSYVNKPLALPQCCSWSNRG